MAFRQMLTFMEYYTMLKTAKPARDAFTISLGGLTTISGFAVAPAIASDRLNQVQDDRRKHRQDERPNHGRDDSDRKRGLWPLRLRRAT